MKKNKTADLKQRCVDFFKSLTELTGTYFLSDYVENIDEYLTEKDAAQYVKKRNDLRKECEKLGVDFHGISCDVADDFLKSQGIDTTL